MVCMDINTDSQGCFKAPFAVILFLGSTVRSPATKDFAGSKYMSALPKAPSRCHFTNQNLICDPTVP